MSNLPPGFPLPLVTDGTEPEPTVHDIIADAITDTDRTWSGNNESLAVQKALSDAGYEIVKRS